MFINFCFIFLLLIFRLINSLDNPHNYENTICDNPKTYYYNSTTVISYGNKGYCLITLGSENYVDNSLDNIGSYPSDFSTNTYFVLGDKQNTYLSYAWYSINKNPNEFDLNIYNKETNNIKHSNKTVFYGKNVKIFNLASKHNINYIAFTNNNYIKIYKYNITNIYSSVGNIQISDDTNVKLNTLDCTGLIENYIICIYTISNYEKCKLQLINESSLTAINNIEVSNCINSNGQKVFEIDDSNFYICYFSNDVNIYCSIGFRSSTGISIISDQKLILEGCDPNINNFDKGKLFDIDILVCTNNQFIYMQRFYYSGTNTKVINLVGDLITIKETTEFSLPSIVQISSRVSILTAKKYNQEGIYIYYIIQITCNDYSITCYKNSECEIDVENSINNFNYPEPNKKIMFENIPSVGKLGDETNIENQIVLNQIYNSYKFKYLSDTITTTEFTYYIINNLDLKSTKCKGTINVKSCYVSCNSCNDEGTSENHNCLTCDIQNNYYPLESDTNNNCYNEVTKPSSSYLDGEEYKDCHESCATCYGYGESKCLSCNNHYSFILQSDVYNCVDNRIPRPGYYLLDSNNTFMKCYETCYNCFSAGTELDNNCIDCDNSTYFKIEGTNNCVNQCPEGFGKVDNIYKKCTLSTCKKCGYEYNDLGKCIECKDNFYLKDNENDGVCYDQTSIESNYYLNKTLKRYKQCNPSCETCFGGSDSECYSCEVGNFLFNNKCSATCASGYAFELSRKCLESCPIYTIQDEDAKKCINCKLYNDENIKYLKNGICGSKEDGYFVANNYYNYLEKCYDSCKKCSKSGNSLNHNCDECKDDYRDLEDDTKMCFKTDEIVEGYKFEIESDKFKKCYESCKTCSETNGNEIDNKCLTCKKNYEKDPYTPTNCVLKCDKNWFKNLTSELKECVDSCPSSYPYFISINNECTQSCNSCSKCSSLQFYKYNYNCVTECPENTILDKILYTCYNLYNITELFKYVGNYISYKNPPPNKFIKSETMMFHLCNTTAAGKSDCDSLSKEQGSSIIDLSNCLSILKNRFSYTNSDYFYIGLLDEFLEDTDASKFEYIIFDKTGRILDNNLCIEAELTISKKLNDSNPLINFAIEVYKKFGYDIINYQDNDFYKKIGNDFYINNNNKIDVLLNDRYKDIYKGGYKLCENFCSDYALDLANERVKCICKGKNNFRELVEETFIDVQKSEQLYYDKEFQYFYNYKNVFNKKIFLKKNFGNYFLISFIFISLISSIFFAFKNPIFEHLNDLFFYLKDLNTEIDRINNELKDNKNIYQNNNNNNDNLFNTEQHFITNKPNPPKKPNYNQLNTNINDNDKYIGKKYAKTYILNNNYMDQSNRQNSYDFEIKNKIDISIDQDIPNTKQTNYIKFRKEKKILSKYFSTDLYLLTIKKKIKIINLFSSHNTYDVFSYKLTFLLLTYSFDFFFTTFFYFNYFIHKLYIKNKKSIWYHEISIGFFSAILSYMIMRFIEYLMEFESKCNEFDDKKDLIDQPENVFIELSKLKKFIDDLKCKFVIYFIFLFICLFFIWYFVTSFCVTYPNTQYSWGMSVLYNIIISFIFPFGFYGIAILIQSHSMNKNKLCLFKFSNLLLQL